MVGKRSAHTHKSWYITNPLQSVGTDNMSLFSNVNDIERDKRKHRHTLYSLTVGRPFQSTGQVVTCWERTQNIGSILPLQPPFPPFSTISILLLLHYSLPHLSSSLILSSLVLFLPHLSSVFSSPMDRGPLGCIYTQRALYGKGL